MQPSVAISCARAMYWSWLPSQPCTSITPGTIVSGPTNVPAMCLPSTGISIGLARVDIRLDHGVFRQPANLRIGAAIMHDRMRRRLGTVAEDLDPGRAHARSPRVIAKDLERSDFRTCCASYPPGLFQYARSGTPCRVPPDHDVVVLARSKETVEASMDGRVIAPRLFDRATNLGRWL